MEEKRTHEFKVEAVRLLKEEQQDPNRQLRRVFTNLPRCLSPVSSARHIQDFKKRKLGNDHKSFHRWRETPP